MTEEAIYNCILRNYRNQLCHMIAALDKGDKKQARRHQTICNGLTATLGY